MGDKIKPWQRRKPKFRGQDNRRKHQPAPRTTGDRSHRQENPGEFDHEWARNVPEEFLED